MTKPLVLALLVAAGAPGWALADGDPPGDARSAEARRIEQQARAAAQAGYCEAATNAAARLAAIDPERHAALRADPAIEACATRAADTARAAPLRALAAGARVRVELATGRVVGTFAGVRGGELLLDEGGGAPTAIELTALRAVERGAGRRSRAMSGLRWGFIAGAAAGAIATLAVGRGGDEEQYSPEYLLLPPTVVGALVGLLIGASYSSERWEPVARW